jgi:hypothetical protein
MRPRLKGQSYELNIRPYVITGVALVGASMIVATPVAPPPPDIQVRAVQLTSADAADPTTIALELSGSGVPILPTNVVENVHNVFINPNFPGTIPEALGAPQQLYPVTGIHNGFFDPSVQSGVTILNDAIDQQIGDGHNVVVYGHSQGATIETLEMEQLATSTNPPSADQLAFVMTGDPDQPNGGFLERFDFPGVPGNLTFPTLGSTFFGATPADTPYPTVIYQFEYDGFADFPKYPANFLADLNALFGIEFVHGEEPASPASLIEQAFKLPTSPGYDGDTTYYEVPTENLPLLDLLRGSPFGNAVADLLQPDLKVLVNLGYGADNLPYSSGYANVATPASGLFPDVNPTTVFNELVAGAQTGVQEFLTDLKGVTPSSLMASLTSQLPTVTPMDLDPSNFTTELQTVLTDNSNALATLVATPLDTFLPAVDDGTAVAITLPTEDINLLVAGLDQLADGNINAALADFTDPIGANTGLTSFAGFEIFAADEQAANTITSAIQSAETEDMDFIAGLPGLLSSLAS